MRLYHWTLDINVPGIISEGLIPNHRPTRWTINDANVRSKGKLFLCEQPRVEYWYYTLAEWTDWPEEAKDLVCLEINTRTLTLTPDRGPDHDPDEYKGDFWTAQAVPPELIRVVPHVNHKGMILLDHTKTRRLKPQKPLRPT